MRRHGWMLAVVAIAALVAGSLAQTPVRKPASPAGTAATQIGGKYVEVQGGQRYQDGKWIEVTYGRPIKRGRQNLFGVGRGLRQGGERRFSGLAGGREPDDPLQDRSAARVRRQDAAGRGIQRLRGTEGERLDPHLLQLAGPGKVRSEQ